MNTTESTARPGVPPLATGSALLRQMHYLAETDTRLTELKTRIKNAKHWVRRRQPMKAQEELGHLHAEAHKLTLHLIAWEDYVLPNKAVSQPGT